ncbi:hypothetical protein Q3G72_033191 [Acer saccharum]|nr:hypothetical protein Q3G72_033191 [Acer saccharum]
MRSRFGVVAMVSGGGGGGRPREREIRTGGVEHSQPSICVVAHLNSIPQHPICSYKPKLHRSATSSAHPICFSFFIWLTKELRKLELFYCHY